MRTVKSFFYLVSYLSACMSNNDLNINRAFEITEEKENVSQKYHQKFQVDESYLF